MTDEEMLQVLDANQSDENKKKELIKELSQLDIPPSEQIVQAVMRLIRKPTIPEASENVYDAAVAYLKSICRY